MGPPAPPTKQNFLIEANLRGTDTRVNRLLSCPANARFSDLHEALQIAFGLVQTNQYEFVMSNMPGGGSFRYDRIWDNATKFITFGKAENSTLGDFLDGLESTGPLRHASVSYRYGSGDYGTYRLAIYHRVKATPTFFCVWGEGNPGENSLLRKRKSPFAAPNEGFLARSRKSKKRKLNMMSDGVSMVAGKGLFPANQYLINQRLSKLL